MSRSAFVSAFLFSSLAFADDHDDSHARQQHHHQQSHERVHRLLDLGLRTGVALPLGAFDRGTHANDVSFATTPVALDGTVRIGSSARWNVSAGAYVSYAAATPKLCGSTSECLSSIGNDFEIAALARFRGPRVLSFVYPEGEIATGWSWSTRELADGDVEQESRRTWAGPLLVRLAFIPTFALGSHTRFGVVVGTSLIRTSSFHLEAPGIDRRSAHVDEPRFHGTLDLAARFGVDL